MSQHIALFQPAFLGDLLLTLPALWKWKQHHPQSQIKVITRQTWVSLLSAYPFIDQAIGIQKKEYKNPLNWKSLRKKIMPCDVLYSAHRSLSSRVFVGLGLSPSKTIGFRHPLTSCLFHATVPYNKELPELRRIEALFELQSTTEAFTEKLPLKFSDNLEKKYSSLLKKPFAILAPGSRWATKRWPFKYFVELAVQFEKKGLHVIWTGTSTEVTQEPPLGLNLIDKTNLIEWLYLISKARLVICNDSAATHACTLHQVPVVTLFGPTIPEFGYAPLHPQSRCAEQKLDCRPCTKHGSDTCPLQHHQCMEHISPDTVYALARELLEPALR